MLSITNLEVSNPPDGEEVALKSGSVLRVSPRVRRCLRCTGSEVMVYLCVQAREGSLEGYTMTDGVIEAK